MVDQAWMYHNSEFIYEVRVKTIRNDLFHELGNWLGGEEVWGDWDRYREWEAWFGGELEACWCVEIM